MLARSADFSIDRITEEFNVKLGFALSVIDAYDHGNDLTAWSSIVTGHS